MNMLRQEKIWIAGITLMAMLCMTLPAYAQEKAKKPLKVIILAGQSNMQKPAGWHTLKGLADSPETKPLYDKLVDENGKVRIHENVYETVFGIKKISRWKSEPLPPRGGTLPDGFGGELLGADKGGNFGTELGFGVTLYEKLKEPVLIIKTAWGGKSLHTDFRPPIAGEWIPPTDHPDHPDNALKPLPIPTKFELPNDFQPPEGRGKNVQLGVGLPVGEISGVYPIYILGQRNNEGIEPNPIQKGDMIIGLNGQGLGKDPVSHWRKVWWSEIRKGDWMIDITLYRDGKILTVRVDTAQSIEGGRASLKDYMAKQAAEESAAKKTLSENGGQYYQMMIERIKLVLADPGKFHPAYDPKQGYEIAGFVWFQGFNDRIAGGIYPSRNRPGGYGQYTWLLGHFIRNVRKELNAPKMPVVVGVFGQGGKLDKPDPFREAQTAIADYDEFKGTVAAVQTAPFWDGKIPVLQSRRGQIMAYDGDPKHPYAEKKQKIIALEKKLNDALAGMTRHEKQKFGQEIEKQITDIVLTPEEQAYLKNNVSNQGYHYYGSPKFFVRAGDAFAEALYEFIK